MYVLFITPTKKILDAFTLEVNYCDAARGYVIQLCDTWWQLWDPVCQDMPQEWQVWVREKSVEVAEMADDCVLSRKNA